MPARPRRLYDPDAQDLLAAVEACRRAAVVALAKAPCGVAGAQTIRDLLDVLDRLAETLTGDREHFWTRPSTTPKKPGR